LKKPRDIQTIGLLANPEKPEAIPVVRQAARLIARSGRRVVADADTITHCQPVAEAGGSVTAVARQCDLLLVFGGDGTMLRIAREAVGSRTPILGINLGGLGFLTAVPGRQIAAALRKVWAGNFTLETRALLEAKGTAHGKRFTQLAFNDFVMSRGMASRLIELDVAVDGETLTRYRADGLIISSPTGSTAYSLAAGGAIVSPSAHVFAITPICPHTLSNRSVIVGLQSTVSIRVASERLETIFTADGQWQTVLQAGDTVQFRQSRESVRLLRLDGSSFFQTLRAKLHWSGSSV
jgi:NAD+ kinase